MPYQELRKQITGLNPNSATYESDLRQHWHLLHKTTYYGFLSPAERLSIRSMLQRRILGRVGRVAQYHIYNADNTTQLAQVVAKSSHGAITEYLRIVGTAPRSIWAVRQK